jgi:DNA repair protein RecO (recombination protein O)
MPRTLPKTEGARDGGGGEPVSEIIKDRSVVLKTYPYGESSVVAVVLTRSHGKVRLLAKGARSSRSALQGSLRTGNVSEIVFYSRPDRGLQLLKEIGIVETFEAGGGDLERLCLFQAGLEIVDRSVVERSADERAFDLIERFMRLLPAASDPWALFFALEIDVLKLAGSFPSTAACASCRRSLDGSAFGIEAASGLVSCASCGSAKGRMLSIAASALVRRMDTLGLEGAGGERLDRSERKEIGELVHRFFVSHVEGYRLPYALRLCKGVNGQ